MKQFLKIITILVFVLFALSSCTSKNNSENQNIKNEKTYVVATASAGGTFYPVGAAIATAVTEKLSDSGIKMSAITSAGSAENVKLLKEKEIDFAILQGLFGQMAWEEKGNYQGSPEKSLRAVTMLWENVEHFVVDNKYFETGNMNDIKNIKTVPFSIGKRNSGTEISGITILEALGYKIRTEFTLDYLGYAASANAMIENKIVAMNIPAGPPVAAVNNVFNKLGTDKVSILEFTDEQLNSVRSKFPVWSRYIIKSGTYPNLEKDIHTISQPNFLAVRPDLPEEDVYKILEVIYSNLEFLHQMHSATEAIKLDRAVVGLPIPLHPGAKKFYSENGIKLTQVK